MNVLRHIRQMLVICLILSASACGSASSPPDHDGERPNVLVILVDDFRPAMGAYGDPVAVTPNMDRLAQQGLRFDRAYVSQAVCGPSRTSLLTGLRPDRTQIWDNNTYFRERNPELVTLPQYFKQNGYETISYGKVFSGRPGAEMHDPPSWSNDAYGHVAKEDQYVLPENRKSGKAAAVERADVPDNAYSDGQFADAAIETLKELGEQPFFMAVGFMKPHLPFTAPDRYWDLYDPQDIPLPYHLDAPRGAPSMIYPEHQELGGYSDVPKNEAVSLEKARELRHGYYASISYTDAQIGRVLDALTELGLDDRTIVVLWGDHGYHLGEQNHWAKSTNLELDTRNPLIIRTPGKDHAGVATASFVETIDLYPTLVELAGLPAKEDLDGMSMVPLLADPSRRWKEAVLSQFPRPWSFRGQPEMMGYSLRTERYRYTEWLDFTTREVRAKELYDLESTGIEVENLAGQSDVADAQSRLEEMLSEARRSGIRLGS